MQKGGETTNARKTQKPSKLVAKVFSCPKLGFGRDPAQTKVVATLKTSVVWDLDYEVSKGKTACFLTVQQYRQTTGSFETRKALQYTHNQRPTALHTTKEHTKLEVNSHIEQNETSKVGAHSPPRDVVENVLRLPRARVLAQPLLSLRALARVAVDARPVGALIKQHLDTSTPTPPESGTIFDYIILRSMYRGWCMAEVARREESWSAQTRASL